MFYILDFIFLSFFSYITEEMGFVESVKPNASGLAGEVLNVKSIPVNSVVTAFAVQTGSF